MADDREPPPLFDDDNNEKQDEGEDLFTSATEQISNDTEIKLNGDKEEKEEPVEKEEKEPVDLFSEETTTEVPLDSPESEKKDEQKPVQPEPAQVGVMETVSTTTVTTTRGASAPPEKSKEEEEEEEGGDRFSIEITVTDPKKMGDGMNAYMAFKVNTKTTLPQFKKTEMGVYRRFSDFLGLHEKLVERHLNQGRIIPPPPEKSVLGMTKIKMSKEESGSQEFVEKRRAALERFLNRTARHPSLKLDPDFREFLEMDGTLPKSTSTSAISGAGMMRFFNKVGDSFGKMAFKMEETDQWFEEKQQQIDALDQQLRKLHASIEALVAHRKELATNTGMFSKSAAMLGNAEEHTALSRALSQLAEVEENVDRLHLDQADSDFFVFSELIKDYIFLVMAVKEVFQERVKIFKNWKEAEQMLGKKREAKAKLELAMNTEKIPRATTEIKEWETKVEEYQNDFERISKTIRQEVARFEKQRVKDFKSTVINYLESLMNSQQQLIKYWETFLPEAKAIA